MFEQRGLSKLIFLSLFMGKCYIDVGSLALLNLVLQGSFDCVCSKRAPPRNSDAGKNKKALNSLS